MADTDVENKSNKIVEDFTKGAENKDFRSLINDIQDMSKDPKFATILDAANKKLDAAYPQLFGDVDIIGTHEGKLRLKRVAANTIEDVPARPGDAQTAQAQGAGDKPRVKTSTDGSTIEYVKQADGKEHPTKVVHPDGQTTAYTYDASGKPNSVTEYRPDGSLDKQYKCSDGQTWVKTQGQGDAQFVGNLVVGDDGSHNFTNAQGSVTRRADGSWTFRNSAGQSVGELPPSPRRADAPTQNTDSGAQQNAERPAPQGDQQQRPATGGQPANAETFAAKDEAYNPVGPPGLGECTKGEQFSWEKAGPKGLYDIDNRSVTSTETNPADKSTTYRYKGEIDDGVVSDTNFEASERYSESGKLLDRHIKYDGGVDMTFKTPNGKQEIENVTEVNSSFDAASGNYISSIVTEDGTRYRAVTGADGTVKSFDKSTDDKQSDAPGDTNAQVANFAPKEGVFNPVRPQGIGEMAPGEAISSDKDKGVDNRESHAEKNADGSVTYRYSGEIEDSTWYYWGDSNYTASETVDAKGNLVSSSTKFDSGVTQKFQGPRGAAVEISDVIETETHRSASGGFETTVRTSDGKVHTFVTGADGVVSDYKKPAE